MMDSVPQPTQAGTRRHALLRFGLFLMLSSTLALIAAHASLGEGNTADERDAATAPMTHSSLALAWTTGLVLSCVIFGVFFASVRTYQLLVTDTRSGAAATMATARHTRSRSVEDHFSTWNAATVDLPAKWSPAKTACVPTPREPLNGRDVAPRKATIYLRLFGGVEVLADGEPVFLKQGRRAKALLAALAMAGQPASRQELFHIVLGDLTSKNKRNYFNTIADQTRVNLSQASGLDKSAFIVYDRAIDRYRLGDHVRTDLEDFENAEQEAALAEDGAEMAPLQRMLELHRGAFAPGVPGKKAAKLRDQYRIAALRAAQRLVHHYQEAGDMAQERHFRLIARALAQPPSQSHNGS
ncbi:hypothetical protein [Natronoglycomyces albus]|uniref:Uncharacterized protein n=1 Tax=Natronoglycomyces albus TaxID=2811108 RepID=A0A895XT69_9ACTN|nr:hypothetical protein [Natronoglycomyces albus]QSB06509.1 hypothetical protein JQS30_06290 [Natronoglycomyces albus]